MSRIPLSPGVKERVSANVARLIAGSWTPYVNAEGDETGYYAYDLRDTVTLALHIEEAVTEALAVDTTPTPDGKPF